MTQEELDAMMAGDEIELSEDDLESSFDEIAKDEVEETESDDMIAAPYPTEDNKPVFQLDDVTRDSEVKAGEVFDQLDFIGEAASNLESINKEIAESITKNITLFTTLIEKFPNIKSFNDALTSNQETLAKINESIEVAQGIGDNSIQIMDIMQYQDIHRQKIERVINVMRSLSSYMNHLFEGKVEDAKRVSSAKHIAGDNTEDVVDNDDIEALIASFGNN